MFSSFATHLPHETTLDTSTVGKWAADWPRAESNRERMRLLVRILEYMCSPFVEPNQNNNHYDWGQVDR